MQSTKGLEKDMATAEGYISVNASNIRGYIERGNIKTVLWEIAHESQHNYADFNDPRNNTEELADKRGIQAWNNLSYVNKSEIDNFYQKFNFSQFKK